jgi:3-isopropylmalate/(R)-2-methylmalate dehydratase large subunit
MAKTLAEKVWDAHVVRKGDGDGANAQPDLLFIDLHLVHEVTSPQAFEGLRLAGRQLRRADLTIATEDHNTPTLDIDKPIADLTSRTQIQTLRNNCAEFGVRLHSLGDAEQGIVHVVGPQLGLTQPGMTVVCGRLAHLHAWCLRGAGHGHWNLRGGTCDGHPDAVPEAVQDHGHQR